MERISFDFDGVASTAKGKELIRTKIRQGFDVWIITARQFNQDSNVFKVAESLGIRPGNIVFTNGKDKFTFVERYEIAIHYDNNPEQIEKIKKNTDAKGVLFTI